MDEIIKSLYLRLDANTSTLTRSAIGQILVKILKLLSSPNFPEDKKQLILSKLQAFGSKV